MWAIANLVDFFQKEPPGEGEWPATILGLVIGVIIGASLFIIPPYIGEVFFGTGGWIVGFIIGFFLWWKLTSIDTSEGDEEVEHSPEVLDFAIREGLLHGEGISGDE